MKKLLFIILLNNMMAAPEVCLKDMSERPAIYNLKDSTEKNLISGHRHFPKNKVTIEDWPVSKDGKYYEGLIKGYRYFPEEDLIVEWWVSPGTTD